MVTVPDRLRAAIKAFRDPMVKQTNAPTVVPGTPASANAIPNEWSSVPFAPGRPLEPWTYGQSYRDQRDKLEPRTMDYVPSVNVTISPRIGYGLLPFSKLRYYAEEVPETAMFIRLTTEEMKTMRPVIKDSKNEIVEVPELQWMLDYPDGHTAFPLWLSRLIYNIQVYDAPALFRIRDENHKTQGLRVIDGSTIFAVIDERGEQPAPPSPAFTQIIQGTPFIWLTSDQLWYRPRQARADAPYGRTPVEDCIRVVQYLDNLWRYEEAKYTEGNMPEMFLTAPEGWTAKQTLDYETTYNERMSGNNAERRRIRFLPPGFQKVETKQVPWDKDAYMTAFERAAYTFGFPLSEMGKAPGEGLGGKGFQDKGESQHYRQGIGPLKMFIESPFNDVLREEGYEDYTFELVFDNAEIDAERRSKQVLDDWMNSIATLNEARESRGYAPVKGPMGDARLVPSGKAIQTMDQMADAADAAIEAKKNPPPVPGQAPVPGEKPEEGSKAPAEDDNQDLESQAPNQAPESAVPEAGDEKTEVKKAVSTSTVVEDHSNDAMLALFLPPDVQAQLAGILTDLPEGSTVLPPDEYHVTLAYLGEIDQLPFTFQEVADVVMEYTQAWVTPILGRINGFGQFLECHMEGMNVLYASLDAVDLPAFRQGLVDRLHDHGIHFVQNHGFVPHITLAYVPSGAGPVVAQVAEKLQPADVIIPQVTLSWGETRLDLPIVSTDTFTDLEKAVMAAFNGYDLRKHCGVCPDDDAYYGAPVAEAMTVPYEHQGANETDVVAMVPRNMTPRPALWKPVDGEDESLVKWIGGPMYPREEAAYIMDRTMEWYLVPVAYVAEVRGKVGAVMHFVRNNQPAKEPVAEMYSPEWVEKAGVFDYVMGQIDRGGHNWLTHPDDPTRPVLIDNGLTCPVLRTADGGPKINSAFTKAMVGQPLSPQTMQALQYVFQKKALWIDFTTLVGPDATALVKERIGQILDAGMIPGG